MTDRLGWERGCLRCFSWFCGIFEATSTVRKDYIMGVYGIIGGSVIGRCGVCFGEVGGGMACGFFAGLCGRFGGEEA